MTDIVFNSCLLTGWLMLVLGLGLLSIPLALVVGGTSLMGVTLLLARWAGVVKGKHVPER